MKLVLLTLTLALSSTSCGGKPAPPRTSVPDNATALPPGIRAPGPANLNLACRPPSPRCDDPSYDMVVLGDVVESCLFESNGASIRLQLKSSNDPGDGILVAFDGYHGAGTYSLDNPDARFIRVDDHVNLPQCTGGPIDVGKRVSAADPGCGSPACTVRVGDAEPDRAFPKPLTFTVHCESVCENGSDVTCGAVDFTTRADCT